MQKTYDRKFELHRNYTLSFSMRIVVQTEEYYESYYYSLTDVSKCLQVSVDAIVRSQVNSLLVVGEITYIDNQTLFGAFMMTSKQISKNVKGWLKEIKRYDEPTI